MINKVAKYIEGNKLFTASNKLLLAVSGGVDSIVLLHLLHRLHYNCVVAHCNFHLRGEESDGDASFVAEFAQQLGVKIISTDFNTTAYAQSKKISIEMAARELRYNWFEQVRQQEKCNYIVVAHHADDSIETFFLNLTRGTGLKGLTGIAPRVGYVVRPLLQCSRTEIECYAQQNGLNYRYDSSNSDNSYKRNLIRNQIMPLLRQLNPSFQTTMLDNMERIADAHSIVGEQIALVSSQITEKDADCCIIHLEPIKQHAALSTYIYSLLEPYGFSSSQMWQILATIKADTSGQQFFSPSYRALKNRNTLIVTPIASNAIAEDSVNLLAGSNIELHSPIALKATRVDKDQFVLQKDKCVAAFDCAKLNFPLSIRRWQNGDWFIPFGMTGRKKLSDYFNDRKYSLLDKENAWLLVDANNNILWIIGERCDNRYRITDSTQTVYQVELNSCKY